MAAGSSAPFRRPSQPSARTVETLRSASHCSKRRLTDSSIRIRKAHHRFSRDRQDCDRLLTAHRRKVVEKIIKRIAGREIVEEIFDGAARPYKYELAAHDLRNAVSHTVARHAPTIPRLRDR